MDWFLYDNGLRHERVNLLHVDANSWKVNPSRPKDEEKKLS